MASSPALEEGLAHPTGVTWQDHNVRVHARVELLLIDPLQREPEHVGAWHVFLPSDVWLEGQHGSLLETVTGLSSLSVQFHRPRLHAVYNYDQETFRKRFLGPPGATQKHYPVRGRKQVVMAFGSQRVLSKSGHRAMVGGTTRDVLVREPSNLESPRGLALCSKFLPSRHAEDVDLSYVIPVLFHGDDADSHRRRSFYVCTLTSPLCEYECSWDSRILLACLDNSRALPETYDVLDAWMVYGLTELQEGAFFTVNPWGDAFHRGKSGPCCGPYRAVLAGIKGDEKFIQRTLKLTTSWISEGVCMYCAAQKSGRLLYTHFGPRAPHRETLVSNEEFFATGCKPNAWLRLPGFDVQRIFLDWLHLVDLALTPESAASALCMPLSQWVYS